MLTSKSEAEKPIILKRYKYCHAYAFQLNLHYLRSICKGVLPLLQGITKRSEEIKKIRHGGFQKRKVNNGGASVYIRR